MYYYYIIIYTIANKVAPRKQYVLGYVPHIYVFRACSGVFVFGNGRQINIYYNNRKNNNTTTRRNRDQMIIT